MYLLTNATEQNEMIKPHITENKAGSFFALVVRVEDGENVVLHGYKGRHFKTEKAALKSTNAHIAKYC